MLNFQFFKALYSRLHRRLPKSFKAAAISTRHFLKSMRDGSLYLGPLQIIERILEFEKTEAHGPQCSPEGTAVKV